MDAPKEDLLAMAERHVREGEARILRQERIIAEMERDNHPEAERMGRVVFVQFKRSLDLAREHLESLRRKAGQPESG